MVPRPEYFQITTSRVHTAARKKVRGALKGKGREESPKGERERRGSNTVSKHVPEDFGSLIAGTAGMV